ncbi:hypothetical protein AGOR_G00067570 [Albula goreensis]|uniref:Uncharacterized protein n=1 Tax=Albula goreensis TaxID=1534307 RepID=A0A8T3DVK6_9TELE|nr:hypothetical protein AGOR_G00067570 [Albula goreensis]
MVKRASLVPQGPLELLGPVELLVTVVRLALLDLPALLDLLVQMGSPELRESKERADRRVMLEPLAPRGLQGPPDPRARLVFLDLKAPVVLKDPLVPPVSLVLLAELDLPALMVTLVLLALPVPLVKTALRVSAVTVVLQDGREMPVCEAQLEPPERRESQERTAPLVPMVLQVPKVWLGSVVLWVCLVSVEREVSLDFLDLLVNLANRVPLVALEIADPLAPSGPPV